LFHRNIKSGCLIALACLLVVQGAVPPVSMAQHAYPSTGHEFKIEAKDLQPEKLLRVSVSSGFAAYDNTLLDNRTPLVLVHGIGGTDSRLFHWENFLEFTANQKDFQAKYKIYLYHYDSTQSVPNISRDLQSTLKGFVGALGGRKIKILAYSEGGLLTRNALQDPYLNEHTEEVIAIATPFHGSPLANPEWIQAQVKTESPLSLVRLFQKIAYQITGHRYPSFKQDFHWDNFDGAIPADQYVKNNGPVVKTDYALAQKTNFVTYGSYFGLDVDPAIVPRELGIKTELPKERPMPGNLLRKNFLFSLVRNNIGRLPLANKLIPGHAEDGNAKKPAEPARLASDSAAVDALKPKADTSSEDITDATLMMALVKTEEASAAETATVPALMTASAQKVVLTPVSMMMFNDGISPISSTLWLGRYTKVSNGTSIPVDKLWSTLKSLKGNKNVRLFAGLDHRNWMDGNTRTGESSIQDLLNPDEPPRTVFEWIVYDLMS